MSIPSDIWREICLRASDQVLISLSLTSLREALLVLVRDNNFWFERTELLAGRTLTKRPSADWQTIYHSLLEAKEEEKRDRERGRERYMYTPGFKHLDSLLVLEDIYGPIKLPSWNFWRSIESAEVLHYLLDKGVITYDAYRMKDTLTSARDTELAAALLDLLGDDVGHDTFVHLIENSTSNIPLLKLYYERGMARGIYSDLDLYRVLSHSAEYNQPEAIKFILSVYVVDDYSYQALVQKTAMKGNIEAVQALESAGRKIDWESALLEVIDQPLFRGEQKEIEMIRYILPRIEKYRSWSFSKPLLVKAVEKKGYSHIFRTLLEDERLDPVGNLAAIMRELEYERWDTRREKINALVSSPAFAIEKRTKKEVELLYQKNDRTEGYESGVRTARFELRDRDTPSWAREQEREIDVKKLVTSSKELYAKVVRYIVLAQPTGKELIAWIISLRNKTMKTAAEIILDSDRNPLGSGSSAGAIQRIRALLLYLLYPTMTLKEQIHFLKEDGYSKEAIEDSAGLIGAFMGREKIRKEW